MKLTNITTKQDDEQELAELEGKDTLALTIDPDGADHLMHTLSNLYSRPAESVWREIINNALDAHAKSRQTRPIEITFDEKQFIVRDYGEGMNRDDIERVYRKFAASSKRESNVEIGAFGFGAKSPLAITDRFDVSTIKNGKEIKFYIEKNRRGVGIIHFESEIITDEPSGVTVTVPLSFKHSKKIKELSTTWFRYYKIGQALFNGEDPALHGIYSDYSFLTVTAGSEILAWVSTHSLPNRHYNKRLFDNIRIVIGGTVYSLTNFVQTMLKNEEDNQPPTVQSLFRRSYRTNNFDKEIYQSWISDDDTILNLVERNAYQFIVNLPIGSVDFVPSREDIMDTDKSRKAVKDAFSAVTEALPSIFRARFSSLERKQALKFLVSNSGAFGFVQTDAYNYADPFGNKEKMDIQWRGEAVPIYANLTENAYIATAENAGKWFTDELWHKIEKINLFALITQRPCFITKAHNKKSSFLANYFAPNYGGYNTLIIYGTREAKEESLKPILGNVRMAMKQLENLEGYPSVIYIQSKTKPDLGWADDLTTVLSEEELATIAKDQRREQAQIVAERKAKNPSTVSRGDLPIHYGIVYSNGEVQLAQYSANQLATREIILVAETNCLYDSDLTDKNPNLPNARNFWSSSTFDLFKKDYSAHDSRVQFLAKLGQAFEDKLIILAPKSRSLNVPLQKAKKAILIHDILGKHIAELAKDDTKLHKMKIFADMPQGILGSKLPDSLNLMVAGDEKYITDKFARSIYESYKAKNDELLSLIQLGKIFLPSLSIAQKEIKESSHYDALHDIFGDYGMGTGETGAIFYHGLRFMGTGELPGHEGRALGVVQANLFNKIFS